MSTATTVVLRSFTGRLPESEEAIRELPIESQAALRQFSLERCMAYGVDYSDVVELRARVVNGESWADAASSLADVALELAASAAGLPTRITYLRRAAALLRISQVMLLSDSADRTATYALAADVYAEAAHLAGDRERVILQSPAGPLAGWWISGGPDPIGAAIIVGGIEGYAMDFDVMGTAFAARDMDVLLLDGPGQGETRFSHAHYLTPQWRDGYVSAIDWVSEKSPDRPIALVGNSMGGSFAMAVAVQDTRVKACCNNGGAVHPWTVPASIGTFFTKMVAFCGTDLADEAVQTWSTVTPGAEGPNSGYPLLVVQGGRDPMISDDMAHLMVAEAKTDDKELVIFSDGDHCIYNHRSDRDILIADWIRDRLVQQDL